MRESSRRRGRASTAFKEHLFLKNKISKFGRCVVALWPDKPALNLAQRLKCTERYANQIIRGDRKAPWRARVVIMDSVD